MNRVKRVSGVLQNMKRIPEIDLNLLSNKSRVLIVFAFSAHNGAVLHRSRLPMASTELF